MPNISWNEIRDRALTFSHVWQHATSEQADKQSFWNDFFNIFGVSRRTVASFEEPVRRLRGTYGFIDLLWPGKVLIEHKSAGASLEAAQTQAFDYIHDLQTIGRGDEIPRYVLLSDFQRFALYDLEPDEQLKLPLFRNRRYSRTEFPLDQLAGHIRMFGFIPGYQVPTLQPQEDLNLKAVGIMAGVHDTLKAGGYSGHDLERLLVRVLFCLFAEKTGIFEPDAFRLYIEDRTHIDGSDLGARLNELFATLDTETTRRQRGLDELLQAFPYVNGALFHERLDFAAFNSSMRKALLQAANFNWARISPAIFGALFQEVLKPKERRAIGAHYTSERDILRVIEPLFLDALRAEYQACLRDRSVRSNARLEELRVRLTRLRFLDPACGCGNFLVVAYRELRDLELKILRQQHYTQQSLTLGEVARLSQLDVDQFYGIEIQEWPARIAEVALWLMDHQSNMCIHEAFGQPFLRLPLRNSPHIKVDNALRFDWNDLLPKSECTYVLGNPPFVGKSLMSADQKQDMALCVREAGGIQGSGVLDYVTAWYIKAASYIDGTAIEIAFVSTNSIAQGEQPGILWNYLFNKHHVTINFAYQTFEWTSEARGKAHVHVVIISFAQRAREAKQVFSRSRDKEKDKETTLTGNISPYLVPGPNVTILARKKPLCDVPKAIYGSKPVDQGNLMIDDSQRQAALAAEPSLVKFIRPLLGSEEYLQGLKRWCFWLVDASPDEIRLSPILKERTERVKTFRLASKKVSTQKNAKDLTLFAEIRQPSSRYILFPLVSSETRSYIPLGYFEPSTVITNLCAAIPDAGLYHFGVLMSVMHMAWTKRVSGRLKSDLRYSNTLVYNTFPWPNSPNSARLAKIEELVRSIFDIRAKYPKTSPGDLYGLFMPKPLRLAHRLLDRAVDRLYRPEPFPNDQARVEHLFRLYEQLTAPLLPVPQRRTRRRASTP